MPRPRLYRKILGTPEVTYYKPQGVPMCNLEIIETTHEEWEALRLKNVEGLNQKESAKKMQTSQSTFQRIFSNAQKKLATAIIRGMAIKIIQK